MDARLRRFLGWTVFLITSGYVFLDYWNYSRTFHEGGGEWESLLAGRSFAPAQYRIGVLQTAALLARITHTQLRHMFAVIDFVCLGIALSLLLLLLTRTETFRRAAQPGPEQARLGTEILGQWLQATLALGCFLLYLLWSFWYQKPETQATLLILVLSAVLTTLATRQSRVPAALGLIVLAAIGATIRADAVIALHAGFLGACLLPQARTLPLGRGLQATASLLSIVAALAVQYAIMHWLYPHAPRQVSAFQLAGNLSNPMSNIVLLLALFPWWLTLWLAAKRWRTLDGWSMGLLLGSLVHFALFYTLGIAGEVRIFLPFAMTVVPLTVTLAYAAIERHAAVSANG